MQKTLIILLLISFTSCSAYKAQIEQAFVVNTSGVVVSVDKNKQTFKVHWECTNPPFKSQPCVRMSIHPVAEFGEVKIGDEFRISKK